MALMQANKSKQSKPFEKNDNLLEQYKAISYAYSNSQQKIVELEESLRIETINSEEQRAYIEVLKAALESKINDLGLMNFIKDTAKYSKTNHLDLFMHLQSLKENLDNQNQQSKGQDSHIFEMEAFIENQQNELSQLKITNQELMEFNAKINTDIENTIKGLNILDDENKKLKSEKNHVLDYLDELTQKTEKMQQSLDDSLNRIQEKDEFINNLQREIASLHKHLKVLEENQGNNNKDTKRLSFSKDQSSDLMKELEGLKKKYQELINKNKTETFDKNQEEEINLLKIDLDAFKRENIMLRNELERKKNDKKDPLESNVGSTQEKINLTSPYKEKSILDRSFGKDSDVFKKENDLLKKENEQLKLQNGFLMKNLDENQKKKSFNNDEGQRKRDFEKDYDKISNENRDLRRKIFDLQDKNNRDLKKSLIKNEESPSIEEKRSEILEKESKESPFQEKDQKNQNLKKSFNKTETENDLIDDLKVRLEREREQKSKEIKEIYDSLSNTRSELREAKEENAVHKLKIENLENDLKTSLDLMEKKQKLLEQMGTETNELKKNCENKITEINTLNKKVQITKNEVNELQNMIGHWEKQLKASNSERDGLLKELKELAEENYKTKGQIKELNYKAEENKKINGEYVEKIKDYENKLKVLQNNMKNIFQSVRNGLDSKKGKVYKNCDENSSIEEFLKEIKENFNAMVEENEKISKEKKELAESFKENEQITLKKFV